MWGLTLALGTLSTPLADSCCRSSASANQPLANRHRRHLHHRVGTVINMVGRRGLKIVVAISITCEVVGSLGLGTVLLLFYRENPFSVLFSSAGIPGADAWVSGPMLLAIA